MSNEVFAMDDVYSVILEDKREIRINDDISAGISISINGEIKFTLPYPSLGYGGGSLFLSPSESYLLFAYYSGQSEEAFVLFKIGSGLEMVFATDYFYSDAACYSFFMDEKILIAQSTPNTLPDQYDWWQEIFGNEEEGEIDGDGDVYYDFGAIRVLDIERKSLSEHAIRIYHCDDLQESEIKPFAPPEIENAGIRLSMPWGRETLALPLEKTIKFYFGSIK